MTTSEDDTTRVATDHSTTSWQDPSAAGHAAAERSGRRSPWAFGRHRVDIGQLVMGLVFLGFVGCWALIQSDAVGGDDIRWLMPVPWVVGGAIGLVATAVVGLRRSRGD